MIAPSKSKLQIYDSWDLAKPKTSPRSKLYHLLPIGLGTARTESLTAYIGRLAAEHCLTGRSLFSREIAPASNKPYLSSDNKPDEVWTRFVPALPSLNGLGRTAYDWVKVLQKLTLQPQLRYLTMLRWRHVLSEKSLSRTAHAWCPRCYQEQRESGQTLYDLLLWTLVTVEVCPFHNTLLETKCPHCNRQLQVVANTPGPGYCSYCYGWLGFSERKKKQNALLLNPYQVWVANQMAELIAAAPTMASDPPQKRITDFVPACIERISNGNVSEFARLVNVNKITVYSWCYSRAVPQNDLILKVCHAIGSSFADILTKKGFSHRFDLTGQSRRQVLFTPGFRRHVTGAVKRALFAALKQDPPPALRDVAHDLGYASPDPLYAKYSELCRKLTARHRTYYGLHRNAPDPNEPDDKTLEQALQKALTDPIPPSFQQLGRDLGYRTRFTPRARFRKKFPVLYKAILDRHMTCRLSHMENVRRKLEEILLDEPPPTLDEVTERLGYQANTYLRQNYPDLVRAIVQRHAKSRKASFRSLGDQLRAILHEKQPVSLRTAARRLGRNPSHLGTQFPEIGQAITQRYRLFISKRSRQRKKQGAARIRATALELHSKGEYPSRKRIVKALGGAQALTGSEIGEILTRVRRKLKL
jgi:AraC-like DNA-binding protein